MKHTQEFLREWNDRFQEYNPEEIVSRVLSWSERPVLTTNFRPYEAAILHLVSRVYPEIPVIWCDTGYNTAETYLHAEELIRRLGLKIHSFTPLRTVAHQNAVYGGIPMLDDPLHTQFTEEVKLEPFRRAMQQFVPDTWFTNLRKGQTALRDRLDVLSLGRDGILKVSPFYHYSDSQLQAYMDMYELPNEFHYFDPTKVEAQRECGLHT